MHRSCICPFSSPGTVTEIPGLLWIADVQSFRSTQSCPDNSSIAALWPWPERLFSGCHVVDIHNSRAYCHSVIAKQQQCQSWAPAKENGLGRRTHVRLVSEAHGKDN